MAAMDEWPGTAEQRDTEGANKMNVKIARNMNCEANNSEWHTNNFNEIVSGGGQFYYALSGGYTDITIILYRINCIA